MLIWQKELRILIYSLFVFISIAGLVSAFVILRIDHSLRKYFNNEFEAEIEMVKYFLEKDLPIIELPPTPMISSITSTENVSKAEKDAVIISTGRTTYRIVPNHSYINQIRTTTRLYLFFIILIWISVLAVNFFFARRVLVRKSELSLPDDHSRSLPQFIEQAISKVNDKEEEIKNMVNMVSHELKNSLSAILAIAHDKKLDQNKLNNEVTSMLGLLDRMALYTRPVKVKKTSININDLISDVISDFEQEAKITISFQSQAKIEMSTDPILLDHILRNIILNSSEAIENQGNIKIDLHKDSDVVIITIIDDGPGIDQSDMDNIFKPFFTTKTDGTGLGLCIVKRFVETMDGQVSVQSNNGKGTKVIIKLPYA